MIRTKYLILAFIIAISTNTLIGQNFWTEKVSVTESSDGSIVCNSDDSYAGHAYSVESIPAGMDGYFQFVVNNCYGMVGITSDPQGGGYAQIDHAFQLWASRTVNIMENGATKWQGTTGSWSKGDVLRIERAGGTIRYYKNGSLLYTSLGVSTGALYADFVFGGANTGFDAPVLSVSPVVEPPLGFWTEKVSVTESSDGSIVCNSDDSYAGHAYSVESIPAGMDGYFQFVVNNCYGMVGITSDPQGGGYAQIDHAFQLWASRTVNIMENGATKWQGTTGSWSKGDVLRIERAGGTIRYYKNGILLYTSLGVSTGALYADFVFGGANTGFDAPVLSVSPVVEPPLGFWTEKVSVTESSDGSIVCNSDDSYAGHAYSVESIPAGMDGYFQFVVNNCYGMVGITSDPQGGGYAQIDHAFQLWASRTVNIMENGATKWQGTTGSWSKGDVLRIERAGGTIKYYKNGILLYTSLGVSTGALYADFVFGGANTGFDAPVLSVSPVVEPPLGFWTEKVSVTESSDGSIVCNSDDSYAGHAYSVESIPAGMDGYFQFVVNNCYGMVGITSDPQGGGYAQIDHAFQLWASRTVNIMENGATKWQGTTGSWSKGDVLRIERTGGSIRYYKNGSLLYTSLGVYTGALYADFVFGGANTGFDNPIIGISTVITAVNEPFVNDEPLFYPNPVVHTIQISEAFIGKVEIYSLDGILVKSMQKSLGANMVDIDIPKGMYQVRFVGMNQTITKQMVVK